MFILKKNRLEVYSYLFKEGVLVAKKDNFKPKHDEIDVPNLEVMNLMKSLKSRGYVRETFNWQYYYWYLTNEGIEYLREYLCLPAEIVPATLKKSNRPTAPPRMGGDRPGGDRPRGDRPGGRFGGDRDGYRSGPPGAGRGDKGGAPGEFNPEFRGGGGGRGGFGRGGGGAPSY